MPVRGTRGPAVHGGGYRSTEQVIKEVVTGAVAQLTVVSYATRDVESLRDPLLAAITRGVSVRMVLKHYDVMSKTSWESRLRSLGELILGTAEIYIWPLTQRPSTGPDVRGSLHTKCLLADRAKMLLTSANWTLSAMESNMELGLLVDDADTVKRVVHHFDALINSGVLCRWQP